MMSNTIMDIEGEDSKPQQGEIQTQEYVVGFLPIISFTKRENRYAT